MESNALERFSSPPRNAVLITRDAEPPPAPIKTRSQAQLQEWRQDQLARPECRGDDIAVLQGGQPAPAPFIRQQAPAQHHPS